MITSTSSSSDMNMLNGVRTVTMLWIMLGSTFACNIFGAINVATIDVFIGKPFALVVLAGILTSDALFFLAGFFLAYKLARDLTNSYKKYFLVIFQRLIRILPAFILTVLFWYSVFIHLASGPRWIPVEEQTGLC